MRARLNSTWTSPLTARSKSPTPSHLNTNKESFMRSFSRVTLVLALAGATSLSALSGSFNGAAHGEEVGASDSKGINLTIYNQNFGLVKDIRSIGLTNGVNYVRFADVAAKIDPTSVSFLSLTAPNAVVVRE